MKRRVFNALAVVSLVLCLATLALWADSYVAPSQTTLWWSEDGALRFDLLPTGDARTTIIGRHMERTFWEAVARAPSFYRQFPSHRLDLGRSIGGTREPVFIFYADGRPAMIGYHWTVYARYWVIAVAFAIVPASWTISRLRTRQRSIHGRCPACGYDLRATPDRCPECGTAVGPAG